MAMDLGDLKDNRQDELRGHEVDAVRIVRAHQHKTLGAAIFALVFTVASLVGGLVLLFMARIPSDWVRTDATVLSVSAGQVYTRSGATTYYSPHLQFKVGNDLVTVQGSYRAPSYTIGQSVPIAYNPRNPTQFKLIEARTGLFIGAAVCGVVMLIFAVPSVFLVIMSTRWKTLLKNMTH